MAYLNDLVLDAALALVLQGNRLDICTAEPATYADATGALSLGSKAVTLTGPSDRGEAGGGRKVTVPAIADGSVSGTGSGGYWALSDTANSRLVWAGPLANTKAYATGDIFTLDAFDLAIPDAV